MSVVRARPPDLPAEPPRWAILLGEAAQLARMIANTNFVPKAMRGDEAAIAATILYGDEVGLPPMQALAKIAVIEGKPSLSAEAQRALIQAAGHSIRGAGTTTKYTWTGTRGDTGDQMEFTWTIDDARRAGVAGKQNWRQYPRAMLSARASAELARALFADVIGGLAATEELETGEPGVAPSSGPADPPAAAPEETAPSQRRRRPARTPPATPAVIAPTPPASTPDEPPLPPLPDDYPDAPAKASDQQLKKLFALFREKGLEDRADRLAWTNQHLDRIITSAGELTDAEASSLISQLEVEDEPDTGRTEMLPAETADPGEASSAAIDHLSWLRKEAGVSDDWLRAQLQRIGVTEVPKRITREVIRRLNRTQVSQLKDALSSEIDMREN